MNILHVTLGDPRVREGGLNRYCLDLSRAERNLGNNVSILFPGSLRRFGKPKIKNEGKGFFSLINPLPVSLTLGIDSPSRYMRPFKREIFKKWLAKQKFDVIHVHSFQGIPLEFFLEAKNQKIKLIFTTHDYYPFCPKCALVNNKNEICESLDQQNCSLCNKGCGLSRKEQFIIQSSFYQKIKKNPLIKKIKIFVSTKGKTIVAPVKSEPSVCEDFTKLLSYYSQILCLFDVIHCNSKVSEMQYKKRFPSLFYAFLPITHAGINRLKKAKTDFSQMHIVFMGGASKIKGYYILQNALNELDRQGLTNWTIDFFGGDFLKPKENDSRKKYHSYVSGKEEESIWNNCDILVAPSIWYETFGFVVLEALAHDVPTICTSQMGVSFLVQQIDPVYVIENINPQSLAQSLASLFSKKNYREYQEKIENFRLEIDIQEHAKKILELYH